MSEIQHPSEYPTEMVLREQLGLGTRDTTRAELYVDGLIDAYEGFRVRQGLRNIGHLVCDALPARRGELRDDVRSYMRGAALGLTTFVGFPSEQDDMRLALAVSRMRSQRRVGKPNLSSAEVRARIMDFGSQSFKAMEPKGYQLVAAEAAEHIDIEAPHQYLFRNAFGFIGGLAVHEQLYTGAPSPDDAGRIQTDAIIVLGGDIAWDTELTRLIYEAGEQ